MLIRYGVNNMVDFHNRGPIVLRVPDVNFVESYNGMAIRISKNQARRIEKHFCGVSGCQCSKGSVVELSPYSDEFGVPSRYYENF